MRRILPFLTLALTALLLAPSAASAQRNLLPNLFKSGDKTRSAFASVVADAAAATAEILCDGKVRCLGTVVEADGYIITKASELEGGKIECKLAGKTLLAKVVGVKNDVDLALLKVEAKDLKPAPWASKAAADVGSWLASVSAGKEPLAVGVVSVPQRAIPKQPGALGIQRKIVDGKEPTKEAQIGTIYPNSAAAAAGLKVDDIITHINGKAVPTFEELATHVRTHSPGDVIHLRVKRGSEEFEVDVELSSMSVLPMMDDQRGNIQNRMGGKLSTRRHGFAKVIQHDTVLRPEDCGGPIVGLDGKVLGINIARAGRVESYALPFDLIQAALPDLKSGKFPPPASLGQPKPNPDEKKVEKKAEEKKPEVKPKAEEKKAEEKKAEEKKAEQKK